MLVPGAGNPTDRAGRSPAHARSPSVPPGRLDRHVTCRDIVTASAQASPPSRSTPATGDELFEIADRALYEAKRRGRDCTVTAAELIGQPLRLARRQRV